MKHCPHCFCEYEEVATKCADCSVDLVPGSPTEAQRSFNRIHINPSFYQFRSWVLFALLVFASLFFLGFVVEAINTWPKLATGHSIRGGFVPGGLGILIFFGIAWYSLKAFRKRQREYSYYKRIRAEKDSDSH